MQLCKSFCSWRTKTRWQREKSQVCGEEELLRSRLKTKKNRFWSVYSQFAVKFHLEQEMWMEGRKPLKQNLCAKRNKHTTVCGGVFPRPPSTLTWEEEEDEEGKSPGNNCIIDPTKPSNNQNSRKNTQNSSAIRRKEGESHIMYTSSRI
jgi:hypothetical protein